jgi:thiamine-phosphate pyrophosphorylase
MRQGQGKIPSIWLMTDERVADADLLRAVARLPRGSAVVLRHHSLNGAERHYLLLCLRRAARRRHLLLLLAGDANLAWRWGADGYHGRGLGKSGLHSAPVHTMRELIEAEHAGADVLLISPLFATRSHPGAQPLGAYRFAALARQARVPVIALGGVRPRHATLVRRLGASGYAAIDGLVLGLR